MSRCLPHDSIHGTLTLLFCAGDALGAGALAEALHPRQDRDRTGHCRAALSQLDLARACSGLARPKGGTGGRVAEVADVSSYVS